MHNMLQGVNTAILPLQLVPRVRTLVLCFLYNVDVIYRVGVLDGLSNQTTASFLDNVCASHLLEYLDGTLIINALFLFLQVNQALVQFLL